VLEGIEGLQLKFECLPTDLRHEQEPYGPRQIAPIREWFKDFVTKRKVKRFHKRKVEKGEF